MLLLKIIFALMLMYAFFRIVTWLNDANNHESISIWLSQHLDSSDKGDSGSDGSGSSSSDSGSSGSDGGGGGD